MANNSRKILILGIGNILMGDEGIGARVAQFLAKQELPDGVDCLDGGTGGFHLLGPFQDANTVILIDATLDGEPPGTIKKLEPKYSSDYPKTLTAHDIGLKDLLDAVQILGEPPKVILFTVSIESPPEPSLQLSEYMESRIEKISKLVLEEVNSNARD